MSQFRLAIGVAVIIAVTVFVGQIVFRPLRPQPLISLPDALASVSVAGLFITGWHSLLKCTRPSIGLAAWGIHGAFTILSLLVLSVPDAGVIDGSDRASMYLFVLACNVVIWTCLCAMSAVALYKGPGDWVSLFGAVFCVTFPIAAVLCLFV